MNLLLDMSGAYTRKLVQKVVFKSLSSRDLTLYALSSENIKRNSIGIIFSILSNSIGEIIREINRNNEVRINIIGEKKDLPTKIINILKKVETTTKFNKKLNLNVAFNYGGRNEIIHCINSIIKKNKYNVINEKIIRDNLYLPNLPDPDILIRTGGFNRLSNFLLFQLSYTDLFFTETLWPDITTDEIIGFFNSYNLIEKKYGL